ncbi:MAG: hypothetical protein AB7Q29_03155 [Vicinamibacterales bacterium]
MPHTRERYLLRACRPCAVLLFVGWSTCAAGQTDSRLALGMALSMRSAPADEASAFTGPTVLWRLGRGGDGWGWRWGLNWYSTELGQPDGGSTQAFGRMRLRPFMAGYGYERRVARRVTVSGGVMAGYALVSFDMSPLFNDAYRARLGATTVRADPANAFTARPEASVWIDISRKIGLNIATGYVFARPDVTIVSSAGRDTRQINADMFQLRVGAVYSVF